jgi:two-component system sensor histidine kinase PilS (NtrC family)
VIVKARPSLPARLGPEEELKLLSMFRLLQAAALGALLLTPIAQRLGVPESLGLAQVVAVTYLCLASLLFAFSRALPRGVRTQALIGAVIDIVTAVLVLHSVGGVNTGLGTLTLTSVALTALLLPPRTALAVAVTATLMTFGESVYSHWSDPKHQRDIAETGVFALSFLLITGLIYWLGQRSQLTQQIAESRGRDLNSLGEINELIIQRLRTGVLVLTIEGEIQRVNESAWYLMGMPSPAETSLLKLAPKLFERFRYWLGTSKHDAGSIQLAKGVPAVVPRFLRIGNDPDAATLVFLEDDSRVSRKAEELTLASLGRLSASIAHEVRNPLGAISHAAQLLTESEDLNDADKRLIDIIMSHCARVNGIVENVLQLARRERSRPEDLLLAPFLDDFMTSFKLAQPLGQDRLRVHLERPDLRALIDPSQLSQVLWNLVRNALRYGREPDRPAEVLIRVTSGKTQPGAVIEVIDRGPGIPPVTRAQLFEPFFTTRADGTGLGLYITKQLLEANQSTIEYVPVAAGGSCFRIQLVAPTPWHTSRHERATGS